MDTLDDRPTRIAAESSEARQAVFYVSSRPEAYEIWGEVSHDDAREFGELIARKAAERFPHVEFQVTHDWHIQAHGMEAIASYIESHWQTWVAAEWGKGSA